jgi:thiosulfate/3-mercaptopyruvate sulfurtransferase
VGAGRAEDGGSDPAELEAIYRRAGPRPDDDVDRVLPDRRAVQPHLVRAHHLLGYQTVRNYDGSWTEWGNAVRVPIVKGEEPG